MIYAGAPIPAKDLGHAIDVLGPVLVQYYGLGEVTGNITVLPTWMHESPPEESEIPPAGFERTGMQVSTKDADGNELPPDSPVSVEEWCGQKLPRYKAPHRVVLVDELPTSGYGKVTKNLLRALLEERDEWPVDASAS